MKLISPFIAKNDMLRVSFYDVLAHLCEKMSTFATEFATK